MKRFSVQQFFKNAAEVWASSPRLRSKSNCTMKENNNLRENRKNRNCLQNQKVIIRVKVSGAIAIPKASWGCAPALPNRIRVVFQGKCFMWNSALWKTNCVRFGRIASLFAFVLFAGGCVVRIVYKCFLDENLPEVFLFLKWRTAFDDFS